jgi:hypothetical protein
MTNAEKQKTGIVNKSNGAISDTNTETLESSPINSSLAVKKLEQFKEKKMERKYLENVMPLKSGVADPDAHGRECYLFGALESTLQYLGEPVDYSYLMGVSGCAFRVVVTEGRITACGPDVSSDYYYPLAIKAVGYEDKKGLEGCGGEAWKDIPKIQQSIQQSLNENVPVLTFTPFPFWSVIIGYDKDEFILNRYFEPETKMYIDEGAFHIIQKNGNTKNKIDIVRESFRIAVAHSNMKKLYGYKNGIAGFEEWIKQLRTPLKDILKPKRFFIWKERHTSYEDYWHANSWSYMTLVDARSSAVRYLQNMDQLFPEKEQKKIRKITNIFQKIEQLLRDNWNYFPMRHWIKPDKNHIWSPAGIIEGTEWTNEMRLKGADVLEKVRNLEIDAYRLMEDLI